MWIEKSEGRRIRVKKSGKKDPGIQDGEPSPGGNQGSFRDSSEGEPQMTAGKRAQRATVQVTTGREPRERNATEWLCAGSEKAERGDYNSVVKTGNGLDWKTEQIKMMELLIWEFLKLFQNE